MDVGFAGSKSDRFLVVAMDDGRWIVTPLSWYPSLLQASPRARAAWVIQGKGRGIQWPELDLDLSVAGMLAGAPESTRGAREKLPTTASIRLAVLRGDDPATLARVISGRLSEVQIKRLVAALAGSWKAVTSQSA